MSQHKEIVIPYISGDGIGPEIMAAARSVVDASLSVSEEGDVRIRWEEHLAGDALHRTTGQWLQQATLDSIAHHGVALKGPLTTPVGGGIRSLNVTIRQKLDLYCSVRPVRYFKGVPSPVRSPERMNVVIFRENTEDVYKGIEWKRGSREAKEITAFLREKMGIEVSDDTGLGLKPMSEFASKRLIRAALNYALRKRLPTVTMVHKGNIMKFTEGAFRDWGYELAHDEFPGSVVIEEALSKGGTAALFAGKVVLNDRIADNMFQQILTRPQDYSVLATPNLNGDYLADACAAQIGGLGFAPGANIGDRAAVFEAVHGTAPKYAGKDLANPCSMILSGAMMLEHLGYPEAAERITKAVEETISDGVLTQDAARMMGNAEAHSTKEFTDEVVRRLT
ncbi:MAG TPA: NADP-dependent isocitrate dehydrogenase [Thermoplasmata archaeon]